MSEETCSSSLGVHKHICDLAGALEPQATGFGVCLREVLGSHLPYPGSPPWLGLLLREPEPPKGQESSSSKTLCTYRVQLLPHEHLKAVPLVQQVERVRHLAVPAEASEEAHLQGEKAACVSTAWRSLSQTTPLQLG